MGFRTISHTPSSSSSKQSTHSGLAVGETVILLLTPLPLVGVSIGMKMGCQ